MSAVIRTPRSARRTLAVCGGVHALHDGFTDLLNVLYPLLQAQFSLSYAAVGGLKTVYSAAMASGQIPAGQLARRFGGVVVLASGTALIGVGYLLAGFSGSMAGAVIGLALAGLGGATQHPIASSLVAAAYPGLRSRPALGTYNFTGDVGKVVLPALFALVAASLGWQEAMIVMAGVAVLGAGIIIATMPPLHVSPASAEARPVAGQDRPWAYWLLFSIHIADGLVRSGFLIFLPFLLRDKGADLPTIGLGLSLVFAGGAAGKLAMGWVGARFGVVPSVVLSELATTAMILALLPLPLVGALALLPLVGLALNGTSSVLYGTVPEFVSAERRTHAFAVFYTGGSIAGAVAPLGFGLVGDLIGLAPALAVAGCVALATVPLAWALRPAFRAPEVRPTSGPSG
ncbi:MAG: MFS transporter [Enhydrobacter sp.]|nr:MAG: MFS transporter [Enhydrobacter sp.]